MGNFSKADKMIEEAEKLILEGKVYQGMDILKCLIRSAENVINGKSENPSLDMLLLRRQIAITNKKTINDINKRITKANILIEKYKHLDKCKHIWKILERLGMFSPQYKCECNNCESVVIYDECKSYNKYYRCNNNQ